MKTTRIRQLIEKLEAVENEEKKWDMLRMIWLLAEAELYSEMLHAAEHPVAREKLEKKMTKLYHCVAEIEKDV